MSKSLFIFNFKCHGRPVSKIYSANIIFCCRGFFLFELFCKLLIDPIYFYLINTYNLKDKSAPKCKQIIHSFAAKQTAHADYLFIGNSRTASSVNPQIFMQKEPNKTTIVAGKGYTTPGTHYQAIKSKLAKFPEYLKNSLVFIQHTGNENYYQPFDEGHLRVYEPSTTSDQAMPHLLLPYLDYESFLIYEKQSTNSIQVKLSMAAIFFSSFYRSIPFITEQMHVFDKPLLKRQKALLTSDGGIRNDKISLVKEQAIALAKKQISKQKPAVTTEALDKSMLAYFNKIVTENGGRLSVYVVPMHSIQKRIYTSQKERLNQKVFEQWLTMNDIPIIYNKNFKYADVDLPDVLHLSRERRDDFSLLLYQEIKAMPQLSSR